MKYRSGCSSRLFSTLERNTLGYFGIEYAQLFLIHSKRLQSEAWCIFRRRYFQSRDFGSLRRMTTLIQVQKNAFLFNWRLREEDYPRFESVFETFRTHRSTFIQFLKEDLNTAKIEQAKYQLTYVNLFEDVPYWSGLEDTPKIFPSFAFINPGLKDAKPRDLNSTTIFQVEDDLVIERRYS
jgi:hypothetical protein